MDFKKEFDLIMEETAEIALATAVNNVPDVRIVNFYYDKNKKIVYFATFPGCSKIEEMEINNRVAFTTVPKDGNKHVKTNNAIAKKSTLTIFDIKKEFSEKLPFYEEMIDNYGESFILYEISFNKVRVILSEEEDGEAEITI